MEVISMLIVEDNPGDADLIKEYLREVNTNRYKIEEAATMNGAVGALARKNIDLVLLDLSLPDSKGLDTLRTVTANFPQVVIVILTGLQDEQVALQAVRYGAQDYLEKNQITPALLHRSITYSMERKKALLEKEDLLSDLSKALEQLEALEEILPICASCKKIRDKNNNWHRIEDYIKGRSSVEHGRDICPQCLEELYPGGTPHRNA
jgi:CheY-like chemotaxis protein